MLYLRCSIKGLYKFNCCAGQLISEILSQILLIFPVQFLRGISFSPFLLSEFYSVFVKFETL